MCCLLKFSILVSYDKISLENTGVLHTRQKDEKNEPEQRRNERIHDVNIRFYGHELRVLTERMRFQI